MASFEEMNPGLTKTDGHAERKELGLPDTQLTPEPLRAVPIYPAARPLIDGEILPPETNAPITETKHYADGSSATGTNLPDHSLAGAAELPEGTEL